MTRLSPRRRTNHRGVIGVNAAVILAFGLMVSGVYFELASQKAGKLTNFR